MKYRSSPFGLPWVSLVCLLASFGVALLPLRCTWASFGTLWGGLGTVWGAIRLPLGAIGRPLGRPWLALGALGSLWVPLGSLGSLWELNVHRLRCLSTKSSLLEHATGATGTTGAAEVVSRTAARSPLPHAPGARMAVVTQTPLNYVFGCLHQTHLFILSKTCFWG